MKFFNLLLCAAGVSAVTTACDENLIGNSIIETGSHLIVDSAYTISGESVENSKIQSRTISQLLGKLYAEEYGSLQSARHRNRHGRSYSQRHRLHQAAFPDAYGKLYGRLDNADACKRLQTEQESSISDLQRL